MQGFYRHMVGALALIAASGSAVATVVTFEGIVTPCTQGQVDSEGLSFNTGFFQCDRNGGGVSGADNGTNFLFNGASDHTVTKTNGSTFNLLSIDLGISFYNANPIDHVTLTAFFHGGGSASTLLEIAQPAFTTHDLRGLGLLNLDSFTISVASDGDTNGSFSYPGYVAVDNIVYRAAPEPTSLALLGLGLGLAGLGFSRRK